MAKKGGAQPGAGRPKGSTTKVRIDDYFTDIEKKAFFDDLKIRAKTSERIALYLAEQMTGKAVQPVSGDEGNPIAVKITGFKYIVPTE